MKDLHIGDKLKLIPKTFCNTDNGSGNGSCPKMTLKGTVVYIHPKLRFFTAEFEVSGGKVRESFQFSELEETNVTDIARKGC